MFYKIGFYVLLAIVIACGVMFVKTNPMKNNGVMSWVDIYSENPDATLTFLNKTFDITYEKSPESVDGVDYNIIKSHGQMWPFAGVMKAIEVGGHKVLPHSMIYLTVKDYDSYAKKMRDNGAIPMLENMYAGDMKFGVYIIPGGIDIGIAQYGIKK